MRKFSWKMSPKETGLKSIGASPRSHQLQYMGEEVATVYPNGGGWQRKQDGWYWVVFAGDGIPYMNTVGGKPCSTVEIAKAEALAYFKEHIK